MNAVEFKQMSGSQNAALDLVDVHHIKSILRARIVLWTAYAAERRAQHEPADTAHAVDTNFHFGSFLRCQANRIANFVQTRLERHSIKRLEWKTCENFKPSSNHRVKLV